MPVLSNTPPRIATDVFLIADDKLHSPEPDIFYTSTL